MADDESVPQIVEPAQSVSISLWFSFGFSMDCSRSDELCWVGMKDEAPVKRDSLRYLEFLHVAAIQAVIFAARIYSYAKERSGPLKPCVQTVESTVKGVVGPVYDRFSDVPFELLKFVDQKVRPLSVFSVCDLFLFLTAAVVGYSLTSELEIVLFYFLLKKHIEKYFFFSLRSLKDRLLKMVNLLLLQANLCRCVCLAKI